MTQFSGQYHVCFPSSSQFPFYLKFDDEYCLSLDDVKLFLSNDSTLLKKKTSSCFKVTAIKYRHFVMMIHQGGSST